MKAMLQTFASNTVMFGRKAGIKSKPKDNDPQAPPLTVEIKDKFRKQKKASFPKGSGFAV